MAKTIEENPIIVHLGKNLRLQQRAVRRDGWTPKKCRIFFDHLGATCNVRMASDAAGIGHHAAYQRRRMNQDFAEQWQAALEAGYNRLETLLIERAERGAVHQNTDLISGNETPVPDIETLDTDLALKLVIKHKASQMAATLRHDPHT